MIDFETVKVDERDSGRGGKMRQTISRHRMRDLTLKR